MESPNLTSLLQESLLTRRALATKLMVSEDTVQTWTIQKRIPHFRLGHRTVRYHYSAVMASLNRFYEPPQSTFSRRLPSRAPAPRIEERTYQLAFRLETQQMDLALAD